MGDGKIVRSLVTVWSKSLTFKLINTFASRAARASGRDLVSNFAQTASAKGVHTTMSGHTGGCSCRKQISSGNTLGRVDGFDQDEAESKRDERAVILRRLLAWKAIGKPPKSVFK
jgi:hypothetical protein